MDQIQQSRRHLRIPAAVLLCIITAFVGVSICSMNSFLYPMNDWLDINCFYTVGRGMFHGLVPYRDLYEQKGPLLYFLYGLADLAFPSSYLGAWLLEWIAGACFLWLFYKTVRLFTESKALWIIPVAAFAVFGSFAFAKGGSAEELCLPFFMGAVYVCLRYFVKEPSAPMPCGAVAVQGLCAGCVFWIKFTLVGLYAAWAVVLIVFYCRRGFLKQLFIAAALFIAGFAVAALPWFIYFGVNGAVGDWLSVYILDNIFLYAGRADSGVADAVFDRLGSFFRDLACNVFFTAPAWAGMIYATVRRKAVGLNGWFVAAVWSMFGALALGVYIGSKIYYYYCLPLSVFAAVFALPCARFAARVKGTEGPSVSLSEEGDVSCVKRKKLMSAAALALAVVLCGAGCFAVSGNTFSAGGKDAMFPQLTIAEYIREDSENRGEEITCLNFAGLDGGIYRAVGAAPPVRYFAALNVATEEMTEKQFELLEKHGVRYVVTYKDIGREKLRGLPEYELVYEQTYYPGEVYRFVTTRTWSLYRLSSEYTVQT